MELEIDKKEFERIQQELIQATAENITLEYFEYEGKKWLKEDFVIPISAIQNKKSKLDEEDLEIYDTDSEDLRIAKYEQRAVLDFCNSLLEERNK